MKQRSVLRLLLLALLISVCSAWSWLPCPVETRSQVTSSSSSSTTSTSVKSHDVLRKTRNMPRPPQHESTKRRTRGLFDSLTSMCASVPVPLDHSNPSNTTTITLFVKCYTSTSSTGQLWMLQGGPGASSWYLETLMANMVSVTNGQFDVCTTDFRGVDRSTLLNCVATEAMTVGSPGGCNIVYPELEQCSAELQASQNPNLYTSTQAAEDLYQLIQGYPKATTKTIIYGASYGTLWLSRYVQLYPNGGDGFVFDSVVNPYSTNQFDFSSWDSHFDAVVRTMLSRCGSDSFCSSKLTSTPLTFATNLYTKLFTQNSCTSVTSTSSGGLINNATILNNLVYSLSTSLPTRPIITALFYRLNRCSSNDIAIANWLAQSILYPTSPVNYCDTSSNDVIYNQVTSAELFNPNITLAQVTQLATAPLFSPQAGLQIYYLRQNWTTFYDRSAFAPVSTTKPVLILNGDLDTQTPIDYAQAFYNNIDAGKKTFGTGVGQDHVVATAVGSDGSACGYNIIGAFATNPTSNLVLTCLASLQTDDWQGLAAYNQYYVNTTDLYEGTPSSGAISATPFIIALVVVAVVAGGLLVAVIIMAVQMAIQGGAKVKKENVNMDPPSYT